MSAPGGGGAKAPQGFVAFARATRAANRVFAAAAAALTLAILAVVLIDVALRWVAEPTLWANDVARFLLVYLFFLALAPALESGHHVAVDLFDRLLPRALRPLQRALGAGLCIAFGAVLLWQLSRLTGQVFADNRLATAVLVVPLKWIYVIGPLGALQFVLTALVQLGRLRWPDGAGRAG